MYVYIYTVNAAIYSGWFLWRPLAPPSIHSMLPDAVQRRGWTMGKRKAWEVRLAGCANDISGGPGYFTICGRFGVDDEIEHAKLLDVYRHSLLFFDLISSPMMLPKNNYMFINMNPEWIHEGPQQIQTILVTPVNLWCDAVKVSGSGHVCFLVLVRLGWPSITPLVVSMCIWSLHDLTEHAEAFGLQKQLVTGIASTMGLILRDIVWRLKHVNAPKAGNIWKWNLSTE